MPPVRRKRPSLAVRRRETARRAQKVQIVKQPRPFKKGNMVVTRDKQKVILKYCQYHGLNPPPGGITTTNYSANGMFDPNLSASGHQPLGFDQWMAFYNHYTVIASKLTVVLDNANAFPLVFGVMQADDVSNLPTTVEHACERKDTSYVFVPANDSSTKPNRVVIKKKFTPKIDLGISKPMSSSVIRGDATANPAEQSVFSIFVGAADGASDPPIVDAWVQVTYTAILTEPKDLAQS